MRGRRGGGGHRWSTLTRLNAVHALMYLIDLLLLAVAVVFYPLGAPFVAALEKLIIYAGAIMVLFVLR